ncbi:CapA family protein [Naasia sp. SYSU D00057]|uniref:CapA family protein n=1 Tax=Naasia sp. SYSU D00057 TaxID=2817380 RepID=UPI001B30568B|nr:CapA family protein [Naasia sp. SYSU D00057]
MTGALLRDRLLMLVGVVAASAIVAAMVGEYDAEKAAPPQSIDVWLTPQADPDQWSIQFAGDTMLADEALPFLEAHGYDYALAGLAPLLDGDLVIANAEAPISEQKIPLNPGKAYNYNSDPAAAAALARAGVDVLGLGNNHSMDMGVGGMLATMRFAAENGMVTFGAGVDVAQAERPLLVHSSFATVGVVALGESFGKTVTAGLDAPGTVAFSPEAVQRGYDLARAAGADWVIAYVHWGDNYTDTNQQQWYWARMMVRAGYDMIIGHGPHIVAPIQYIGDVPVAFSVGNFAFGSPGLFRSRGKPGLGLLVKVVIHREAPADLVLTCIQTDNRILNYAAQPCTPEQTAVTMRYVEPALVPTGPSTAALTCDCLAPPAREP